MCTYILRVYSSKHASTSPPPLATAAYKAGCLLSGLSIFARFWCEVWDYICSWPFHGRSQSHIQQKPVSGENGSILLSSMLPVSAVAV